MWTPGLSACLAQQQLTALQRVYAALQAKHSCYEVKESYGVGITLLIRNGMSVH